MALYTGFTRWCSAHVRSILLGNSGALCGIHILWVKMALQCFVATFLRSMCVCRCTQVPGTEVGVDLPEVSGDVALPSVSGDVGLPSVSGDVSLPSASGDTSLTSGELAAGKLNLICSW